MTTEPDTITTDLLLFDGGPLDDMRLALKRVTDGDIQWLGPANAAYERTGEIRDGRMVFLHRPFAVLCAEEADGRV